ncbi:MAG: hypothetical protein HRU20_29050, partial [Pseudomonadales bacterium]|nr:hypothetical protein [Pseudomonadales bacterium]
YRRWQTLILGLFSFVVFVWGAIDVFEVDAAVMMVYFTSALMLTAALVTAALICVLLLKVLTWFRKRLNVG